MGATGAEVFVIFTVLTVAVVVFQYTKLVPLTNWENITNMFVSLAAMQSEAVKNMVIATNNNRRRVVIPGAILPGLVCSIARGSTPRIDPPEYLLE